MLSYMVRLDYDERGRPRSIEVEGQPNEQEAIRAIITAGFDASRERSKSLEVHRVSHGAVELEGQTTSPTPMLSEVIDQFLRKYPKEKKLPMYKKHKVVLPMLLEVVGNKPVNTLFQKDLNCFFELVCKLPPDWKDQCADKGLKVSQLIQNVHRDVLAPKTFRETYVASVRAFLNEAQLEWQDQGFPTRLTTKGVKYLGDKDEGDNKQRPFKRDELKRLFEGPEVAEFARDKQQAHFYWLLHLGLYTGARVNEICQINPQTDVLQDDDSDAWYLLITEETEADPRVSKSVKTGEDRKVPIHKKLIELGFLTYWEGVKASGARLLFPAWKPRNRRASGAAEKWFRRFLKQAGLRDDTLGSKIVGMHAFRHTLLSYGAAQKLSLMCISGHAQGNNPIGAIGAAKGYIALSVVSPLRDRAELLNQLDYGLNHVKWESAVSAGGLADGDSQFKSNDLESADSSSACALVLMTGSL